MKGAVAAGGLADGDDDGLVVVQNDYVEDAELVFLSISMI